MKEWKKPELTVLVRMRPEEAVLDVCKGRPVDNGPNGSNLQCLLIVNPRKGTCRAACNTLRPS